MIIVIETYISADLGDRGICRLYQDFGTVNSFIHNILIQSVVRIAFEDTAQVEGAVGGMLRQHLQG